MFNFAHKLFGFFCSTHESTSASLHVFFCFDFSALSLFILLSQRGTLRKPQIFFVQLVFTYVTPIPPTRVLRNRNSLNLADVFRWTQKNITIFNYSKGRRATLFSRSNHADARELSHTQSLQFIFDQATRLPQPTHKKTAVFLFFSLNMIWINEVANWTTWKRNLRLNCWFRCLWCGLME